MKRVLSLVAFIIILATSVSAQSDTIVNNGDGKVVIIDKRPKTIVRNTPSPQKSEAVVINVPAPVTNNYYNDPEPIVYPNRLPDYDPLAWVIFLTIAAFGAYFIFFYKKPCHECNHHCNHNPPPPVINHFHVAGGQAIVDGSETWSNYQPETHYHKHQYMPFVSAKQLVEETKTT